MRNAVGLFGALCGLVVIWTVGTYGYSTADSETARWNIAFLFGVIAAAGLFGHAVAVHVWRFSRFWSVMIGLACGVALLINLSNSLGALVGRNAKATAETTARSGQVADDRRELKRLEGLYADIGKFAPADEAAVAAATEASSAATKQRVAECGETNTKRGNNCKSREADERRALDALATIASNKAATDRAAALETQMRPIRERLRHAEAFVPPNVQGHALAKLFRLPDGEAEFAATLQNFLLAAIVEVIIVLCMVTFELLHQDRPARYGRWQDTQIDAVVSPTPIPDVSIVEQIELLEPVPDQVPVPSPAVAIPKRPRPKLAVANKQPLGAVLDFLAEGLDIIEGARTEMTDAFIGYTAWCRSNECRAMDVAKFIDAIEAACREFGIRIEHEGDREFLVNVQLMSVATGATSS